MGIQNVLVVGGSGFIGRKVIDHLRKRNLNVISFDMIQTTGVDDNRLVKADILDLPALQRLLLEYEVQAAIHLVGLPAVEECQRNPHFSFQLNALSVQNTLEAARVADIDRVFFASSASVYGLRQDKTPLTEESPARPETVYGYHKLIAEAVLESYSKMYGIKTTAFRIFNVYGADYSLGKDVLSFFIRSAVASRPLVVKGSSKFRDFVSVEDVAEAFALALVADKSPRVVNIGTGSYLTLRQLAGLVSSHFANTHVIEEGDPGDGTGLVADIRLARSELAYKTSPPEEAIHGYLRRIKDQLAQEVGGSPLS